MTMTRLGDVAAFNPRVPLTRGTVAPYVGMESLAPFTRDVFSNERKPYSGGTKFLDGDILMARITPSLENGKTSIYRASEPTCSAAFGSTEFIVIRGVPGKTRTDFLYYLLTTPDIRDVAIASMTGSSGRQRVQTDVLMAHQIEVPPVAEQRAIAATLGALDDKIESNRNAVGLITGMVDGLSEQWGACLPEVTLGKISVASRRSVSPDRLGVVPVDHFSLPAFDTGARPERVEASSIRSNKLVIERPSVLVSRLNPRFDRTWWAVPAKSVHALASTEYLVLTAGSDVELAAVWLAVRDPFFREEMLRRVTGTSGSHQRVRPDDVLSMSVPDFRLLPSENKRAVLRLLDRAHTLRNESATLSTLRDTLLPELMSGRIRIPEAREAIDQEAGL